MQIGHVCIQTHTFSSGLLVGAYLENMKKKPLKWKDRKAFRICVFRYLLIHLYFKAFLMRG